MGDLAEVEKGSVVEAPVPRTAAALASVGLRGRQTPHPCLEEAQAFTTADARLCSQSETGRGKSCSKASSRTHKACHAMQSCTEQQAG